MTRESLLAAKLRVDIRIADRVFEHEWNTIRMLGAGAREASELSLAAFNGVFDIANAPDKPAVYLQPRMVQR